MKKLGLFASSLFMTAAVWAGCGMGAGTATCPMPGMGAVSPLKTPLLFATLALGYWILQLAEKETTKLLKYTGRTVAAVIFIGSLSGLLCGLCGSCRRGTAHGGMWEKRAGSACPFSGAPAAETEASAEASSVENK